MYSTLRRCPNIILIAGSGFGGSDDTLPYLTGEWALKFAHPCMPFDGVLFGSRVMTALEARTSLAAKQAIVDAPGLDDEDWEKTYKGPAGGVITVRSELGEPIHKLATRGVLLWKEFDDTLFSLPKDKLVTALKNKKAYIIKRINTDFQKPWFGKNAKGDPVDLEDMTYAEVLNRLVELMYITHEKRWIDVSLRNLVGDFVRRLEERFTHEEGKKSLMQSYAELEHPFPLVKKILDAYPEASEQLLNSQDIEHFLFLCGRFIQKPVPFIPILDKDFQGWFKRDSLWQSEDLEAVVGQDVGRVCILQGPMAAKHSKKVDQPIKEIFDEIHEGHIAELKKRYYGDDESKIPTVEYFGGMSVDKDATETVEGLEGVTITTDTPTKKVYTLASQASGNPLPDEEKWIQHLAGPDYLWKRALFTSDVIIKGREFHKNSVRTLFTPRYNQQVEIDFPADPERTVVTVFSSRQGELVPAVQVSKQADVIEVALFENRTAVGELIKLPLLFKYIPRVGFAPIQEVMEGRNDRIKEFYWKLWFGDEAMPEESYVTDVFKSENAVVDAAAISEFCHSVGNRSEAYLEKVLPK
jgi:fatty acid synthase subunit beta